jgi:hypothetical protein
VRIGDARTLLKIHADQRSVRADDLAHSAKQLARCVGFEGAAAGLDQCRDRQLGAREIVLGALAELIE